MLETLINIDRNLFLALNGMHSAFMDPVMWWISDRLIWIPLYVLLAGFLYKKFGNQAISMVLFSAMLILFSDQISVLFKNFFMRERPCHDELLAFSTHIVYNKCGGTYGFVSSHAANTMGVFAYLIFLARNSNRNITIITGIWVCLTGYSRIYLGVHFPADIVGGWIVGIFSAALTYFFYRVFFKSPGIALKKKMNALIAVFIGGGLGSVARYGIGNWMATFSFVTFPLGTFVANIFSSLILGIFVGATALKPDQYQSLRFLIAAGFCGGFSTFSAFSAETLELLKHGHFLGGMINIAVNLIACLSLMAVGIWIGKILNL